MISARPHTHSHKSTAHDSADDTVKARLFRTWRPWVGWFLLGWHWFWKLVEWIGNFDVLRAHRSGWSIPTIPRPVDVLIPIVGLLWLTYLARRNSPLIKSRAQDEHTEKITASNDEGWFALQAPKELHPWIPLDLFLRSCNPNKFARNIRFDPIESRRGLKIWIDDVPSLGPGERVRLGFHVGDNREYIGVVNHFINFFEGGSREIDQPPYTLTIHFLDGTQERTEQHKLEGHPLPRGGVSLDISPAVIQASRNIEVRDWIGEWTESEKHFRKWEDSDVFAQWVEGVWMIRSDRDPIARSQVEAACELAGSRLLHSPGMNLSVRVKAEAQHWKRWLHYLKETEGLSRKVALANSAEESGYIEHLAHISIVACTKCAAKAFD